MALLLCAACEKKPTAGGPTIVGRWQVTDIFHETSYGIVHDNTDDIFIYDFRPSNELVVTSIEDGATTVSANCSWAVYNDTLMMFQHREPGEEPGMPGVMLIQKLNSQTMRWRYLILGDMYIDLIRINNQ